MFLPRNIPGDVTTTTLGMSHLAKDSSAGAGNPLDSEERAVGVMADVHPGRSCVVAVLGGDLAVGGKLEDLLGRGVELAFAMGYRDMMQVIDPAAGEPGRKIGGDAGGDVAGDMTPDIIESQGRSIRLRVPDLSIRYEAGLNQGLEAVTDPQRQAIPFGEKFHDGVPDDRAA